jgi:glucosamine-6-phosphate deaminase
MKMQISQSKEEAGKAAAQAAERLIAHAISAQKEANVVFATGASQLDFLGYLTTANLPWTKIRMFHLDEYVGLPMTHPASFRKYLTARSEPPQ